jgi:hypothetical protein
MVIKCACCAEVWQENQEINSSNWRNRWLNFLVRLNLKRYQGGGLRTPFFYEPSAE